mmetsp:Transcript_25266/g.58366  ORF Transcript_25266/g.58366 Transcript_25266/m.58366 type:complete len:106 (-) Transcript_25266:184-501(-)
MATCQSSFFYLLFWISGMFHNTSQILLSVLSSLVDHNADRGSGTFLSLWGGQGFRDTFLPTGIGYLAAMFPLWRKYLHVHFFCLGDMLNCECAKIILIIYKKIGN